MSDLDFDSKWTSRKSPLHRYYPDALPLAWRLRETHQSRWARFYAFPNGARPEMRKDEISQVLSRFDRLTEALYEKHDLPLLLISPVRKYEGEEGQYGQDKLIGRGLNLIQHDLRDVNDDPGFSFDIYGGRMSLRDRRIPEIISDIARDKIMQSILCSDDGDVISPYEGGFDIISSRTSILDMLKKNFSNWTSPQSDGL